MIVTTETIYRCDICGKESVWIMGTWFEISYPFGRGYQGWEHDFHICSEECETKLASMSKQQRKQIIFKDKRHTKK